MSDRIIITVMVLLSLTSIFCGYKAVKTFRETK